MRHANENKLAGLRHVKFLELRGREGHREGHRDTTSFGFVDAVLEDIQVNQALPIVQEAQTVLPVRVINEPSVEDEELPAVSQISLDAPRPAIQAHHIITMPFEGDIEQNFTRLEMQLRSVLQAGRGQGCRLCESADVVQKNQLVGLAVWRRAFLAELAANS